VLIVLISFALGEAALRLFDRVHPSFVFHDDSYNRFRVKPGSDFYGFPVNSLGFLDTEFSKPDGGSFRVVALGDSFAFGAVPYDNNYLTLLEQHLDRPDQRVEVFNMGIPRTAPADYLSLLVNEGLALEPNLVLVSFYIGNDLLETHQSLHRGRPIQERSHLISLLRFALRLRETAEWGVIHKRRRYSDDAPTFSRPTYIKILGGRANVYTVGWEGLEDSVNAAVDAIKRMADLCQRRTVPLVVVLIPEETQLDPELQAALPPTYLISREGTMDFQQPNRILGGRLDVAGIPYLDLYPAFAAATPIQRLYKPFDTHWNIAGNCLAAEQIADFLVARKLVGEVDPR
jgi:hypothetical protein